MKRERDSSRRFVSDTEKDTWNKKADKSLINEVNTNLNSIQAKY